METFHLVISKFLTDSDSCKDVFLFQNGNSTILLGRWQSATEGANWSHYNLNATARYICKMDSDCSSQYDKNTGCNCHFSTKELKSTLHAADFFAENRWNHKLGVEMTHHPIYFPWNSFQPKIEISGEIYSNSFLAYIVTSYYQMNTWFRMQ